MEQRILDTLKTGRPVVLATIVNHSGSTPRTAGARMLIFEDGSIAGTIGGGRLEGEVIAAAPAAFERDTPEIRNFDLDSPEVARTIDMICGGYLTVLIERISPTPEAVALFEAAASSRSENRKTIFITDIPGATPDGVNRCLLTPEGLAGGADFLSEEEKDLCLTHIHERVPITLATADRRLVILPSFSRGTVVIFGAGHVSRALARMIHMVDFRIVVLDDRAEFANRERFPEADEIRVPPDFRRAFEGLSVDDDTYVVILTRGHAHDREVLAQALKTKAGYIGMIGSRQKREAIYKSLLADGFSQEDLDRTHSPIGLSIGAQTPEEIAVSIAAELIQARAGED